MEPHLAGPQLDEPRRVVAPPKVRREEIADGLSVPLVPDEPDLLQHLQVMGEQAGLDPDPRVDLQSSERAAD